MARVIVRLAFSDIAALRPIASPACIAGAHESLRNVGASGRGVARGRVRTLIDIFAGNTVADEPGVAVAKVRAIGVLTGGVVVAIGGIVGLALVDVFAANTVAAPAVVAIALVTGGGVDAASHRIAAGDVETLVDVIALGLAIPGVAYEAVATVTPEQIIANRVRVARAVAAIRPSGWVGAAVIDVNAAVIDHLEAVFTGARESARRGVIAGGAVDTHAVTGPQISALVDVHAA